MARIAGVDLPRNAGGRRNLDRAVVENMHKLREEGLTQGRRRVVLQPYETVRAAFIEGDPIYENAGFNAKNHIQIAVRERRCIKGYFRLPGL